MKTTTTVHGPASRPESCRSRFPALLTRLGTWVGAFLLLLASLQPAAAQGSATRSIAFSNDCFVVYCPPQVVTNYTCGDSFTPLSYPLEIVNRCPGVPPPQIVCTPPPGTPLGVGAHPIHCDIFINNVLVGRCDFILVVVRDTLRPEIRCPDDLFTVACPDPTGLCGTIVNYPAPVAVDNSGSVAVVCNPPSGSYFPCGVTVVTCVATDRCQNKASCQFRVVVEQGGFPPGIQCPADITVETCRTAGAVVNYPAPVVNPVGTPVICVPPSGSLFPVGSTTVSCVASNSCGRSECKFVVTVRFNQNPPQIACPQGITATTCSNCAPVIYPAPAVVNGTLVRCIPASGTCFPVGTTFVVCTATNECGATSCEFPVTVVPGGQPPQIACPQDLTVTTCSNCAVVNYPLPIVPAGTPLFCTPAPGTCFPVGSTTVTCIASNACGRSECKFVVTVRPVPPAQIVCPSNITVRACSDVVVVNYPAPVVNGGALVGCFPPSGSAFPLGPTTVTCRATNACGQVAGCEFVVLVLPGQTPTITCPTNMLVETCNDCAVVNYPSPVVVNGALRGCTPPPGTCFPVGVNTVTCLATNECGSVTCSFTIVVRKVPAATITCPSNVVVTVCGANGTVVNYPAPVVTGGALVGCIPPSGSFFPIGDTLVTCRATNRCGQVVGCEFIVSVRAGQLPGITCPQDISVTTCGNCAVVTYPAPVVVNGTLRSCSPPSGFCFPIGTTTVNCIATNACGSTECKFTVTVRQGGNLPQITCPPDMVVQTCDTAATCVPVNYPAPVVANGALRSCNPPSGFCFPIGSTTVNCIATNACGAVECKFTVTVRQVPLPQITCPSNIVVTTCADSVVVSYPPPVVTGGTAAGTVVVCDPPSGSSFPLGTNTVTCCVIDQCQRRVCCEFQVIVLPGKPCVKPPLNMVLWLPFDEPVGPIAKNLVPGTPNGIHANGPVPFLGQHVANSLSFDGVNDFVRVPNYAAIGLGLNDFSIDVWTLRRDTGGLRTIVSKMSQVQGGIAGYEFYLNNGVMNLTIRSPFGILNFNSGVVVPADNQWHFLTVTVRRFGVNGARFYLDGVQVAGIGGGIPGSLANASSLTVGASIWPGLGRFYRGLLDELEIFNRVLTPAEILGLFRAGPAGKCKVKCAVPWDVSFPANQQYVTVQARIWNCTPLPLPVRWLATGPMPIPVPSGTLVIPPFTCTNVPVQLCRPTNGQPVGSVVRWNFQVFPGNGACPIECVGSVINPGPIRVVFPGDVIAVPGTNRPVVVRVGLNGLPPGVPLRIRAIGPDMEPDLVAVSLNGLPPGSPVTTQFIGAGFNEADEPGIDVSVRFVGADPIGSYTLVAQADVDGDGVPDTLSSVDLENPVIPPPTVTLTPTRGGWMVDWNDEGDGVLEGSNSPDGPWFSLPGVRPGTVLPAEALQRYFRVAVPVE